MNGGSRKNNSLCCRGSRKRLSNFGLVALATLGRHIAHHGVLAVPLATVFRHLNSPYSLLKASQTRPGQKRTEGQNRYS